MPGVPTRQMQVTLVLKSREEIYKEVFPDVVNTVPNFGVVLIRMHVCRGRSGGEVSEDA